MWAGVFGGFGVGTFLVSVEDIMYYEDGGLVSTCIASFSECPFCPFGICNMRNCSRNSLSIKTIHEGGDVLLGIDLFGKLCDYDFLFFYSEIGSYNLVCFTSCLMKC